MVRKNKRLKIVAIRLQPYCYGVQKIFFDGDLLNELNYFTQVLQ